MSVRLSSGKTCVSSDPSDSSSDEQTLIIPKAVKRKANYKSDNYEEQSPKVSRLDSRYNDDYCNRDSVDKEKDDSSFETSNIKGFYDRNYSDKSEDESEEKSQNSYYQDNNTPDYKDDVSKLDNKSSSVNNVVEANSAPKKKNETVKTETVAERIMKKMGYKDGLGLGRDLQGRSEPVSASTQKGRRGLGLKLLELEHAEIEYNPEEEVIQVKEEILWLQNQYENVPTADEVMEWTNEREIGQRKETINGETTFCSKFIVENVVNSKSIFDRLDKNEMHEARSRSNPFETIRGSIFLNRAAVKMANIDKICDFMFTRPSNLQPDELLYFADVCAGPGGFSEYVLWRKKWRAKGFGFTLKNQNDFKLHDFHAGPCETFHPYYGPKEDGDVYDSSNQKALRDLIMSQTENQGVHFMMADGGFSVEGQENIQEILSKQLYLCQCLVALMIVRTGGHFVTKVFDLFTPFSAGLVYIMYRCFNQVSIFKPNTSRPANSERYLICKGKRPDIKHIVDYLFDTNKKLSKNISTHDILELVPTKKLIMEKEFFEYLKESNEDLGRRQIVGLKKIAAYTENKNLFEVRQKSIREQCLKYWELPDEPRTIHRSMKPSTKAQELLKESFNVLEKSHYKDAVKLTKENVFQTVLFNVHDWFCMPCSSSGEEGSSMGGDDKSATFYLGMGRSQVYRYCDKGRWESVGSSAIELPRDTLVYAELITELKKEKKVQIKTYGFHILDAYMLGSENISSRHLTDRIKLINLFCKALWKPVDRSHVPVRAKELLPVSPFLEEKMALELKTMKNNVKVLGYFPQHHSYENDSNEPYYYALRSIVFFKATEKPWACHKSNSSQRYYYYNVHNKNSLWEIPEEAKANFAKVLQSRVIWNWPSDQSFPMSEFMNCLKQSCAPHK